MELFTQILKLLAGVGLFLFAMYLLEDSLKHLSGRRFKIFLQRATKNRFGAVTGGAVVTGVLQSSSMVSLMVLAFVGAGVFTTKNAMAIILGANLGTTLDSWLVATLGFKVNMEFVAYPTVCLAGILMLAFNRKEKIKQLAYFLFGFSLLFIALSFMKTAMEEQVKHFDFSKYTEMPLAVFLLIGFVLTLLVQSSSVTMALTLSALHAGLFTFPFAAAIVLGSETGTTIKIVLGAIGGNASKKRVVLGNVVFNVVLTVGAFILLKPILGVINNVFGIHDPLIGLVTFSTLVNLFAVIVFLPFLDFFATFLEKFFKDTDVAAASFIGHASLKEPQTALDLFEKETLYFMENSMLFNLGVFGVDTSVFFNDAELKRIHEKRKFFLKTSEEKYDYLKQLQGELQSFYLEFRSQIEDGQNLRLSQLISCVRSSMYSVKCINDVESNIANLSRSSKNVKFEFFAAKKELTQALYRQFYGVLVSGNAGSFAELKEMYSTIENDYNKSLASFYEEVENAGIEDMDLTIVINFNREVFTSNKAMLMAVKDFLLDEKEAETFNAVPVYTT